MTGLEQETQNGVRIHPIPPSAPGIGSSPEVFQRGNGDITNTDVKDETADHRNTQRQDDDDGQSDHNYLTRLCNAHALPALCAPSKPPVSAMTAKKINSFMTLPSTICALIKLPIS
jgi:hypothetical protein